MIREWGIANAAEWPHVYLMVDDAKVLSVALSDKATLMVETLALGEKFVIQSRSERGFWSNTDGWVLGMVDAEVYDAEEAIDLTQRDHLPLSSANDTEWVVVEYTG